MPRNSTYGANPYNAQTSYSSASQPYSKGYGDHCSYNRNRRNYNKDYYSEQNTYSTDTYHENTYNDEMMYYDNGLYDIPNIILIRNLLLSLDSNLGKSKKIKLLFKT